jgi:hypothetical protein
LLIANFEVLYSDEGNSDTLVEIWRKSQISRELERLLSNTEPPTLNSKRKRTDSETHVGRNFGLSAGIRPASAQERPSSSSGWLNRKLDIQAPDASRDSPSLSDYEKDRFLDRELESILSPSYANANYSANSTISPEVPELPSEAWHLLDVYFSYTHSWLPIIEKHDLLRTS